MEHHDLLSSNFVVLVEALPGCIDPELESLTPACNFDVFSCGHDHAVYSVADLSW